MILTSTDFFELFDLPAVFDIDLQVLKSRWYTLQKQYHPDNYVHSNQLEQNELRAMAATINQAYRILGSSTQRAVYLLGRLGLSVDAETNTQMPTDFLMTQMDFRERLEAGEKIDQEVKALVNQTEDEFKRALENPINLELAVLSVRKMLFLERLLQQQERTTHGVA